MGMGQLSLSALSSLECSRANARNRCQMRLPRKQKRLFGLFSGLLLLCAMAHGQAPVPIASVTGNITAQGSTCTKLVLDSSNSTITNCVSMQLPSTATTASIVLSGTFSATVQFEISADYGNTWVSAPVASSTTTGTFTFAVDGHNGVRARASAYSSGIIATTISPSNGGTSVQTVFGAGPAHSLPITEASAAPNFLNCGNVNGLYSIVSNVNCVGCRRSFLLTPGAGANRSYDRAEHSDPDKHHQHDVDVGRQHTLLAGLRYSGDLYRIGDHFLCAQWFRKSQHGHDGRFGKHRRGRSVSKQQLYGSCIDVGRNPNRDFRGTWGCDDDYPCLRDDWLRRERSGSDESADYC